MKNEYALYYEKFLNAWGYNSQMLMCLEEMSELSKALCKLERVKNGEDSLKKDEVLNNVKEEIADVLNMAEQLQYYFGVQEIESIRKQKIERTNKFVDKN